MARRPDVFNQKALEEWLREHGCVESMIAPIISDMRLFVPIALRELGEEGLFQAVERSRHELGLGPQVAFWQQVAHYACTWAEDRLEAYMAEKAGRCGPQ